MFKFLTTLSVLVVLATAINGYVVSSALNTGTNELSPFAQIHQNNMQNLYGNGLYGYGLTMAKPINHATNSRSPGAVITGNNMQNTYTNVLW